MKTLIGSRKHPVDPTVLDPLITIEPGDFYDAEQIDTTRRNLLASPYFSNVIIQAVIDEASNSFIPISIKLVAKKKHAYNAEAGVGTDTGLRGGVGYQNRRLNTLGHTMGFRLGGSNIKRSAIMNYQVPYRRSAQDTINFFATLVDEIGEVRRYTATKIGSEILLHWRNSILRFGLTASTEKFKGEQSIVPLSEEPPSDQITELLIPSIGFENTTVEDVFFTQRGRSFSALLRATSESLGSDLNLGQLVLEGRHLFPVGSGRLRVRLKLAGTLINNSSTVPESLGFLAGGDDSIRGYKFESIGVTSGGVTTVGENLVVGSVEYERLVSTNISAAAFLDVGDVFNTQPVFKRGAGLGLRWNLMFGAMRFDVASALDKEGKPLRIHFSIGTDL